MEPSFLLEGIAHPDRFLPPKHQYHCTQMAIRQLERLNGGYRPVYAQRDPILPQTGKLTGANHTLCNVNNHIIDISTDVKPYEDERLGCGALCDNDYVSDYKDLSNELLNTGNISILASSLDGEDIWASRDSTDHIDVLSVTSSIIQCDSKSNIDKNLSDDDIPSPFLQMSCIQLQDLDTVQPAILSPPENLSTPPNDILLTSISVHSTYSISHDAPRIIPTSVDFSGAETGSLRVSELEHTVGYTPDFSLTSNNLVTQSKIPTINPAYCVPIISKALQKKPPLNMTHNNIKSTLLSPKCINLKDKEPVTLNLPPALKLLQQKVRYCGHVKTVPPTQVPGNHIYSVPQMQQRSTMEPISNLPYLARHKKSYGKVGASLPKQPITGELFVLPKLKR